MISLHNHSPTYQHLWRTLQDINRPLERITHEMITQHLFGTDQHVQYQINYDTGTIIFTFQDLEMTEQEINRCLGEMPWVRTLGYVVIQAIPSDYPDFDQNDPQANYYLDAVASGLAEQIERNVRTFVSRVVRYLKINHNIDQELKK